MTPNPEGTRPAFARTWGWAPGAVEVKAEEKLRREAAGEIMKPLRTAQFGEEAEGPAIDDRVYASSSKSFKLEASGEEPARATKRFSLPVRVPYDVSTETFSIVAPGETAQTAKRTISPEDGSDEPRRQKRWDDRETGGTQRQVDRKDPGSSRPAPAAVRRASRASGKDAKTMSGVPVAGTFYVYAFDGRLLAEYDVLGQLVREYIYFGGQLVAEYRNQESRLLYYTSDQINSTRIVTDNAGTVVYAAAHEPYGGIQKTWVSSYDPSLKFSGKQRDGESDLDYFGARYYDKSLYRFLSVDPVILPLLGLGNPQFLNLYAYCGNSPVGNIDRDGRSFLVFIGDANLLLVFSSSGRLLGVFPASSRPSDPDSISHFQEGCFPFLHFYGPAERPQYKEGEPIDELGFYSFDAPAIPRGDRGVHAGGTTTYMRTTNGCIRTERQAMKFINSIQSNDPMRFIVCVWDSIALDGFFDFNGIIRSIESYMSDANLSPGLISRVTDAVWETLENLYGPLNFLIDYWFSGESPIPQDI